MLLTGCTKKKAVDANKPYVSLSFAYGKELKHPPTYAVWVEDESGHRATLFVTNKIAKSNWGADRASVLPIWSGIREENVDAVSEATQSNKAKLQCNLPEDISDKKLTLYIEVNASFDYNDYYSEGLKRGEEGYSDVNGQPSMLYHTELDPKAVRGQAPVTLVGTGEVMGIDHAVHDDLSHVSTAKEILTDIVVTYDFIH
jgi:hypothetical protein